MLRQHNGHYLVGTRRSKLKQFERDLLAEGWEQVRKTLAQGVLRGAWAERAYARCVAQARCGISGSDCACRDR